MLAAPDHTQVTQQEAHMSWTIPSRAQVLMRSIGSIMDLGGASYRPATFRRYARSDNAALRDDFRVVLRDLDTSIQCTARDNERRENIDSPPGLH